MAELTKLTAVLLEIRNLLQASAESDWAALKPAEVIAILDREIGVLETTGRVHNLLELKSLFAPTAEIQEISMASGWSERYLELSSRFDAAIGHITQ